MSKYRFRIAKVITHREKTSTPFFLIDAVNAYDMDLIRESFAKLTGISYPTEEACERRIRHMNRVHSDLVHEHGPYCILTEN